jgi:hypothetical protein
MRRVAMGMNKLDRWLNHMWRVDEYDLCGNEIVSKDRRSRTRRIRYEDIRTWQEVYIGGGYPYIDITFVDGSRASCGDMYEHLFHVLQMLVPEKQEPLMLI